MENDNGIDLAPMALEKSETIGKLAEALAAAQAEMLGALKDSQNPHLKNKYADLASVWAAWKSSGPKHGLAVLQLPMPAPKGIARVRTILSHKSGEWIASVIDVPVLPEKLRDGKVGDITAQTFGSAVTYARRYSLAAMVGVTPEDDDGNAASHTDRRYQNEPPPREQPRGNNGGAARAPEADRDEAFRMLDACKTMRDLDAAEVTIGELVPKGHPYRQLVGERVYATEDRIKAAPARAS